LVCGRSDWTAFSDGVIAIVITIMIIDLNVSQGGEMAALSDVLPCS
jgi:uncharacterized membrane protein